MKPIDRNNLKSHCRTCLEKFKSPRAPKYNILETPKLLKSLIVFTGLNIDDGRDSLYPQVLCRMCFDTIKTFESFRSKAMETEKTLREIVMTVSNEKNNFTSSDTMVTVHEINISLNTSADPSEDCSLTADSEHVGAIKIEDVSYDNINQHSIKLNNSNIKAVDVLVDLDDSTEVNCLNGSTRRTSKRIRKSNISQTSGDDPSEDCSITANSVPVDQIKIEDASHDAMDQDNIDMKNSNRNIVDVMVNLDDSTEVNCFNGSTRRTSKRIRKSNISQTSRKDPSEDCSITDDSVPVDQIKIEDASHDAMNQDNMDMNNSNINAVEVMIKVDDSSEVNCLNSSTHQTCNNAKPQNINPDLTGISNPFELGLNTLIIQKTEQLERKGYGFKCSFCSREFVYKKQFNKHMRRHETKKFVCKICGVARFNKTELATHMRVHDENAQRFQCDQCSMSLFSKQCLERHVRIVHEGRKDFVCDICPRRLSTKTLLQKHTQAHLTKPFQCKICYKLFASGKGLHVHIRERHRKKESNLICKYCPKRFLNETFMREHESSHENPDNPVKEFNCRICNKIFPTKWKLALHLRLHNAEEVRSSCPICSKVFSHKALVRRHARLVHEKTYTLKCSTCPKLFKTNISLQKHEFTHTGKRPFSCEHCAKTFSSRECLRSHMRIHMKRTLFNCKFCRRHFLNEENLEKHVVVHKNTRPLIPDVDKKQRKKYTRKTNNVSKDSSPCEENNSRRSLRKRT